MSQTFWNLLKKKNFFPEETAEMLNLELEGVETIHGDKIESYEELDENAYVINVDEKNNIKLDSRF